MGNSEKKVKQNERTNDARSKRTLRTKQEEGKETQITNIVDLISPRVSHAIFIYVYLNNLMLITRRRTKKKPTMTY